MDGETRSDDSRKTELQYKPQDWVRDALWGKEKPQGFPFWGTLCPFTSRRGENCAVSGILNGKNKGGNLCHGRRRWEDAGFKSSFTLQVVEIHLGHEQSVF